MNPTSYLEARVAERLAEIRRQMQDRGGRRQGDPVARTRRAAAPAPDAGGRP